MWEKRTNWELGTRVSRHDTAGIWVAFFSRCQRDRCGQVPLIMRVPWIEASVGKRTKALSELVDVYQTVCVSCSRAANHTKPLPAAIFLRDGCRIGLGLRVCFLVNCEQKAVRLDSCVSWSIGREDKELTLAALCDRT